ncbi:MAG: glycoside hydrolase family 127 protein, partial [Treponema sp.]|nr:glycoside hydrolase family 127 protein [Treponema sp.]
CYALLPVEAIADEYRATGDGKYLNALLGAWDIYHDHYKHTGGPTAICEMHGPYPPGTRYITTGHNGETCGSVFWAWINQRLVQLYPREEKYIAQIEEVVYNTLCNCRDERGHTRYHIRLHGKKDGAGNVNSCCQVSSTMAISSIPQYIYLTNQDTVFVNLFIPSEFDSSFGKLTMETDFPVSGRVTVGVDPTAGEGRFTISVRAPCWINGPMAVSVNGTFAAGGTAGGRITINRLWKKGDTISFTIPYGFRPVHYTGTDQAEDNGSRYTMLYGPILMALDADCKDPQTIPRIKGSPADLIASLKPTPGSPLHFPVPGTAYTYMPYWDAKNEGFTCLPVIE